MQDADLASLRTLQRQSTELASESNDATVRSVHQKIADEYAEQIAGLVHKREGSRL